MRLCARELTTMEFALSFIPLRIEEVLNDETLAQKMKGATFVFRNSVRGTSVAKRMNAARILSRAGVKNISMRDALNVLVKIKAEQSNNGST